MSLPKLNPDGSIVLIAKPIWCWAAQIKTPSKPEALKKMKDYGRPY